MSANSFSLHEMRGGLVWGFRNLRKDIFVQFIKDLDRRENHGLPDDQCEAVKHALRDLETEATEVVASDGVLSKWIDKPFYKIIKEFRDTYVTWNSDSHCRDLVEKVAHRMHCTDKMRDLRYEMKKSEMKFVRRIRQNAYILGQDLDLRRIKAMHDCFEGLCTALPEIFVNLSKALTRFRNRSAE